MPNGAAQEALIRSVYTNGGMDPGDTGYVEAHGTIGPSGNMGNYSANSIARDRYGHASRRSD